MSSTRLRSEAFPASPLSPSLDRARLAALALGLLLGLGLFASSAQVQAQATLLSGFGGAAGYGADCLGMNDDGASNPIDIAPFFPSGLRFFDRTHSTLFVNTNGNISFGAPVPAFTASPFPVADQPMIAPYWADVDLRGFDRLRGFMRDCFGPIDGDTTLGPLCHDPTENGLWWHLEPGRMIVTWDRVSYYKCHDDLDQRMSFQLILTEVASGTCGALGDFDVEFRYNRCEWNAGDASGGRAGLATATGIPAQAGFDAGNLMDFVMIPGSRTPEIHTLLCAGSNVGDVATNPELAGIWRFEIRAGVVVCPGAGAPCDTGSAGVCAPGRMQCVADRVECRPELGASAEVCDSLDNDCNGMVDDGDLCGPMEICSAGVCVGNCFEGGCFAGFSCGADGYCVEDACLGVSCALGERCEGGACVSPCEGIVCPSGQECRAGVCVDLCLEAVCDDCTVCVGGACLTRCQLEPCAAGMSCRVDGRCVEDACAALSCAVGEVCQAGACVDACLGAICPAGEICSMGACGAAPPDAGVPDAGVTDAGTVDAGVPDGAVTPIDASAADATAGGDASGDGGPVSGTPDAGCACTLAGASSPSGLPAGLLSLGLGLLLTIRRRRS